MIPTQNRSNDSTELSASWSDDMSAATSLSLSVLERVALTKRLNSKLNRYMKVDVSTDKSLYYFIRMKVKIHNTNNNTFPIFWFKIFERRWHWSVIILF